MLRLRAQRRQQTVEACRLLQTPRRAGCGITNGCRNQILAITLAYLKIRRWVLAHAESIEKGITR
eukprot:1184466-Pleurochrysis_carterae.AAC.1